MSRIALLLEYDGTRYAGWQVQPNGMSIQQSLQEAVQTAYGVNIDVVGAGRTDAGVHARGQVAHLELGEGAHHIPVNKIPVALNTRLPRDIRVRAAAPVDTAFHARFDAKEREYVYRMTLSPTVFERACLWTPDLPFSVDTLLSTSNSPMLLGRHDFTTYSKYNASTETSICDLRELSIHLHAPYLTIRIRADRFVYGMCRLLVGALYSVARGRYTLDDLVQRREARDRQLQLGSAPAHGLYLNRVRYTDGVFDDVAYF